MSGVRAMCPAKVNLGLHVAGLRRDGYHEIVTLFQAIDLWDVLEGDDAEALSLEVSGGSVPCDERNLVVRAARLLHGRVERARGRGARLRLDKRIPAEGGLGGGSSDAAGALALLNELWTLDLRRPELAVLATELGSDVPFFLWGGTALGTGRGDTIQPLPSIPERPIVLGYPGFGLSTAEVYRVAAAPLTDPSAGVTVPRLFVKFAEGNDFGRVTNDLERAAFAMRGELAAFRDALTSSGAEVALLSGSGSTVFGLYRAGTGVTAIAEEMRGKFPDWTVRASRTIASGVQLVPAVR